MELDAPGLKKRPRGNGTTAYYWVASAVARDTADYPLKTVRVHGTEDEVAQKCRNLTAELKEWLSGKGKGEKPEFDGTLKSLIRLYQQTPESPYHELRSNSRVTYDESLGLVEKTVGSRLLKNITGIDFKRWYANYKEPKEAGGPERMRRAYKAIQMIRVVMKFGVVLNIPECLRLNTVLGAMEFHIPKSRTETLDFEQVQAICSKAIEEGYPSIALAQALQFELTLRQIDVIGRWEKDDNPRNGGIIHNGWRWRDGLLWSHIDSTGVLGKSTSKTGQWAEHDTMAYPFLRSMIDRFPMEKRFGPMIISEDTGRPYRYKHFARLWRSIADKVGVPAHIWNRDSRAGGVTEGSDAGADIEMLRHHANHSNAQTTAKYNRKTLKKTRTVAELRLAHRAGKNTSKTDV